MDIITWSVDDINQTIDELDNILIVNMLTENLNSINYNVDDVTTDNAIALCKHRLMGEYNAILVRHKEELLCDSEVYLLTWDGEASDGGNMTRLDAIVLHDIISNKFMKYL